MEAKTKIIFVDENGDKFFGEGPYQLLLGVERTGSLRCAAMEMGMAYSKAMKLVRHAEAALGFPLTQRTVGGKDGGSSTLTITGATGTVQMYMVAGTPISVPKGAALGDSWEKLPSSKKVAATAGNFVTVCDMDAAGRVVGVGSGIVAAS